MRAAPFANKMEEKTMKIEISEDILEAITAVVYWARSADSDDTILRYDIPLLDEWVTKLGLLPPANPPITGLDQIQRSKSGVGGDPPPRSTRRVIKLGAALRECRAAPLHLRGNNP